MALRVLQVRSHFNFASAIAAHEKRFDQRVFGPVVSYWDQACAHLNHGLPHEDLFFDTNGEFFFVWERVKPTVEEGRKRWSNPLFLGHLEKAANRYETWIEKRAPGHIAAMRQMMAQFAGQASKAEKAA